MAVRAIGKWAGVSILVMGGLMARSNAEVGLLHAEVRQDPTDPSGLTYLVDNACDVIIVGAEPPEPPEPGDPPPDPEAVTEVPDGATIKLVDFHSFDAVPPVPAQPVHVCDPAFDPGNGELLQGNGIAIEANNVTLDLNGRSIHSSLDVAGAGALAGFDVENAGVAVGATGVTVLNSSATESLVDEFTANYDMSGSAGSKLLGAGSTSNANAVGAVVGGQSHGGGVLAIDRAKTLLVDRVRLFAPSTADTEGEAGDNAIDLKRCAGGGIVIKNSHLEGGAAGIRIRFCQGVDILHNTAITAHGGDGIEFARNNRNVSVRGNVITNNLLNGVGIGGSTADTQNIKVRRNTFIANAGCPIDVAESLDPVVDKIVTSPNNTAANGGTACLAAPE